MPPRHTVASGNQFMVPAYLVTDEDEPDFIEWKRDHPDSFVAGTWELPSSGQADRTFVEARSGRFLDNVPASVGTMPAFGLLAATRPIPLPDPSTVSIEDFRNVAAEARRSLAARDTGSEAYHGPVSEADGQDAARRSELVFHRAASVGLVAHEAERIASGLAELHGPDSGLFAGPGAPTDDPAIARMSHHLLELSHRIASEYDTEIMATNRQLTPTQYGTELHARLAHALKAENLPGVHVEQSSRAGRSADYGDFESIRTDVSLRNAQGRVIAVWDYKTGVTPRMPLSRLREIRQEVHDRLGLPDELPVYVIHVPIRRVPRP